MKRTEEGCKTVRRMYESGMPLEEVAATLAVTPRTARSWILRAGGKMRSLKRAWKIRKARMSR